MTADRLNNGFTNPHDPEIQGFRKFLKWQFNRGEPDSRFGVRKSAAYQPQFAEPALDQIQKPDHGTIQITWIGHSTFLIQVDGVNILTDPIFSKRCSPVQFAGPKRKARPGLSLSQLPEIHLVLQSHDHFDHLDKLTVKKLQDVAYMVPTGLGRWFRKLGRNVLAELGWWQSYRWRDMQFHAVPAQHFSGRSPFKRNRTLWCGWVVQTSAGAFYFAGDTGYCPYFKEIGKALGPMQVSLIPIGAYSPRWFMRTIHIDPFEAVRVHLDVRARRSIGMHWGTFRLTDEHMAEPPILLRKAARKAGLAENDFTVLKFGETIAIR